MQFAATIHEAAARIEEAGAVFRFKARHTSGAFDELGAHWTDSRSKHFNQQFLQPQRDVMDEGERLCRRLSELAASAKSSALQAEDEISAFFALAEEFESISVEVLRNAQLARQSSTSVMGQVTSLLSEVNALGSAIASAAQD